MDNKDLQNIVSLYAEQQFSLDSIVVSSFIKNNDLTVNNGLLAEYCHDDVPIINVATIEDVINVFELAIPKAERVKNGAVYTPKYIRNYILDRVVSLQRKPLHDCIAIDIACGCGSFLLSLANHLHSCRRMSYREAVRHLYGVDISDLCVKRCKIVLSLAASLNNETLMDDDFHICQGNSLDFDFASMPGVKENGGFDIVVGNPPYVRAKHIDNESKELLSRWQVARCGNADLYLPFFEIACSILREDGVLGYITLNSFFKSVNAKLLRNYFRSSGAALEIVDFGDQLIFGKTLAYTCIVLIDKKGNAGVNYAKGQISDNRFSEKPTLFNLIPYCNLDDNKGWNLNDAKALRNIRMIEQVGRPLGDLFKIKNGIATLANDVYIFRPQYEDETFFYLQAADSTLPIEKGICRDIIKPNILHSEKDIPNLTEKVIFPYDDDNKIITEDLFKSKYPKAYKYLELNKGKLALRDKGEKNYEAWYAFGRTQATCDHGRKLLFPYMTDHPRFVYTDNVDLLIYCGYAIFSDNEEDLLILKRILESSTFDYYMRHTAKPYATGFYSYAKNYVKGFGIPTLSNEQRSELLSLQERDAINNYVGGLYDMDWTAGK